MKINAGHTLLLLLVFACPLFCQSTGASGAQKTVTGFLGWYSSSWEKLEDEPMVNNMPSAKDYDSTKFYSVNFKATEKYLAKLKSAGFFSSRFLDKLRNGFLEAEKNFRKNPVNDGPPEGFDYDLILLTQEPDLVFEVWKKAPFSSKEISKNTCEVYVKITKGWTYRFTLKSINKKWLIESIDYK